MADACREVLHAEYNRRLELRMRELTAQGIPIRGVAPIVIERFLSWCDERACDPAADPSRAQYGAELERLGETIPWPPRRNDPCWCGSGRKVQGVLRQRPSRLSIGRVSVLVEGVALPRHRAIGWKAATVLLSS